MGDAGTDGVSTAAGAEARAAEESAFRAPRWYTPALVGLAVVAGVLYLATGGEVTWLGVGVLGAFVGLGAIVAAAAWLFNRGTPREPVAGTEGRGSLSSLYGYQTSVGVFWALFGVWQIASLGRVVLGGIVASFGVLTIAAFGPLWVRYRLARRRAADTASAEGTPSG